MVRSRPSLPTGLTPGPPALRPCPETNTIEPTTTQPVRFGLGNLNGSGSVNPIDLILSSITGIGPSRLVGRVPVAQRACSTFRSRPGATAEIGLIRSTGANTGPATSNVSASTPWLLPPPSIQPMTG